ncbi:MAG TPA: hypothetical protein DCS66_13565 [Flavobacteriaceae bacterium]|nr:hypothetical protein [Flavobacteriaceae bacterium]|tara:strand:+ start:3652 stop:4002 length:351 start_codon:yes stop_codon:yes gene_type:complete
MTMKDLTQRLAEEKDWKDRSNTKTVNYDFLTEEQKKDPKILPFIYKKPFLQEMEELKKLKQQESKQGIMSTLASMTTNELKEFYGGYLVPYGYKEKEIMKMPLKEIEYLFDQLMSI